MAHAKLHIICGNCGCNHMFDYKIKTEIEDFTQAIQFINKVAEVSESLNHHPEIRNVYNKVEIFLCTHDAGDTITDKDKQLAEKIDQVFK